VEKILCIENLNKSFENHHVLNNLNLEVKQGDFIVLTGPSGSGKSTFLNIVGLLDKHDSGTITYFGIENPKPFSKESTKLLKNKIGYLFQNFALIESKTVEQNLMIALEFVKGIDKKNRIDEALDYVGLKGFEKKKVSQCSGGEQQRIAVARIILKPCELVLCDEPTGSLDYENRQNIISLLKKLQKDGKTILIVSHDPEVIEVAETHYDLLKIMQS
jgi:putative ABC transport system ATP-binding protein